VGYVTLLDLQGYLASVVVWRPTPALVQGLREGRVCAVQGLVPQRKDGRARFSAPATCVCVAADAGAVRRWTFEDCPAEAARLGFVPRAHQLAERENELVDTTGVCVRVEADRRAFFVTRAGRVLAVSVAKKVGSGLARHALTPQPTPSCDLAAFQPRRVYALRDVQTREADVRGQFLECVLGEGAMASARPGKDQVWGHLAAAHEALARWATSREGGEALDAAARKVDALLRTSPLRVPWWAPDGCHARAR
jgi:hypothetical protein